MKRKILIINLVIILLLTFLASCGGENSDNQDGNIENLNNDIVIPVEALVIKYREIEQSIPLSGVLKPIHSVEIVAELTGELTKINKKLGDAVKTSDTLAVIDDIIPFSQYRQAQAQVLSAENNLNIAQSNLQSDEELLKNGDISQLAYDNSVLAVKTAEANHLSALANLELMKKNYLNTRIMSPINGLISRKYIELGTMVTPNMPLYRVIDLTVLKIEVTIPQAMIQHVHTGSKVKITTSAFYNKSFEGYVRYISPQADEATGGFNIEIHINNTKDLLLRAGLTSKIELFLSSNNNKLIIPDHSLVTKNDSSYVYKISNGKAKLVELSIAETIGSQVLIDSGLAENDTIVVVGMKNLGIDTKVWIETLHQ